MAPHPGVTEVVAAARRLHRHLRRTPLASAESLGTVVGTEVLLKLETHQITGAFKLRGALNALLLMPPAERGQGVVTASAGNHGLGVAWAARRLGAVATVFVPASAPAAKRSRIERLGALLHEVSGDYDAAHASAERHAAEGGGRFVHPFSDPAIVAGQGTAGLEILLERPDVRTLLVPVGGGGLIGGVGTVARALAPGARVVGVQTPPTSAMHASLAAGRPVDAPGGATLCDGLAGGVDEAALRLAQQVVDELVLVEEAEVRAAMRFLFVEEGVVAEGSAAVVVAALLGGRLAGLRGPVAAVISGGNLDAARLASVLGDDS